MSEAHKCDRCDVLYEPTFGAVTIERIFVTGRKKPDKDGCTSGNSWDDIDLCQKCGREVLKALAPAMNDIPKALLE